LSTLPLLGFHKERKENRKDVRFEVLIAVTMRTVSWDEASCSMAVRYQHFGANLYLQLHECCIPKYKIQAHIKKGVW
jgi:hypothetical protein